MPAIPKLVNRKPNVERRIHRALEEAREKRSQEHRPGIMLSSIGDCPRNLWAALHEVPEDKPIEGKPLAIFALGSAIETHVIQLMQSAGFVITETDSTGRQPAVTAYDGRVRGRLDGVVRLGRTKLDQEWVVLEIKSAKASRFEELLQLGYEAWSQRYADTLHAYMGWGGYRHALVVVYCKDDSRIYAEKIRLDAGRFTALRLKAEYVLDAENVVVRPTEAKSQYCGFCKWCSRNEWCWSPLSEYQFDE